MRPDCLLLDEPTNHLDIESIDWLEGFLTSYEGAVVLVSHDRHFLDAVTTRTVEITKFKVYDEPVAYTRYVEIRTEQRELQAAAARNQQREREKMEQWIDRFRSKASLATRVQSRIKALQRMEEIEVDEQDTSAMTFHFPAPPRSGREVLTCTNVHKSFGEKHVLKGIDLVIERGQKVAFVGRNGEGKSTLVKIIAGLEQVSSGTCELGHNTLLGLYAQHQAEMLGGQNTAFDVLEKAAPPEMRPRIRALLGAFLFRGDDVNKKVAVLSGGEKSRLALARLLLQPYNLLVLDEPTNHLDMLSKEILKEALLDYQGAMIVVSHDRDFLEGLTDAVVEFKGGKVKWYDGDIKQYFEQKPKTENQKPTAEDPKPKSEEPKVEVQRPKNASGSVARKVTMLENEIAQHETDLRDVEEALASPDLFKDPARQQELLLRYEHLRTRLDAAMTEWTTLNEQLETR
jgi:ATP-binding cassette subfamily F protein 3